ncbi:MAG: DUF11 domain-containing protein, partial [Clostridia bacterium]|nr:DUF11 domain-containing protein [Clostridia bacterium]
MKEKFTKKNLILFLVAIIVFLGIVILFANIFSPKSKIKNEKVNDAELARAREYARVEDGQEKVEITNSTGEKVNFDYVQFDAFFLRDLNGDGYAEGVRGTCKEIGKEDTLYMKLNVLTKGYLKDGKITINGDKNYYLQTSIVKDNEVKNNYVSNDTQKIEFNKIKNGTQKLLTAVVRSGDYSYTSTKTAAIGKDINKYSKINSVTLTGTHVEELEDGSTKETPIEKTVEFNVDWYGTTKAEIPQYVDGSTNNLNQRYDISKTIDEEKQEINLNFKIGVQEAENKLLLKKSYIEGTIPQLNGYNPSNVYIEGTNVIYTYNEKTRKFTAQQEAILDENKVIKTEANNGSYYEKRYNIYDVSVVYPLEVYKSIGTDSIEYKIPIKAYYEGYNNENSEFKNPYKSNVAENVFVITYSKPDGYVANFRVDVGRIAYNPVSRYIISKLKPLNLYNGISESEKDDKYLVRWYGYTGTAVNSGRMIMKESSNNEKINSDMFIKDDSSEESMEDVASFIGIYFSDPKSLLGEKGVIEVYDDETGNLLATFDKTNWDKYNESNPYKYDAPVKHIRVETTKVNANSKITVYNIKELDDLKLVKKYSELEFETLKYIKSTLSGYIGESYINTSIDQVNYEAPISVANISINNNMMSTQETFKNAKITIQTETREYDNEVKWINGSFLIKMPKNIIDLKINNVSIKNRSAKLASYEQYEKNGERFIKINIENEKEANYAITIDCDITPDPRIPTTTQNMELYASNSVNQNYYYESEDKYDVNNNLNFKENVNKRTISISLVSPNSILTSQVAKNYDDNGNETIAPQVALVSKEQRTATISLEILNNYSNTISEIKILGKIPTQGNTYSINGADMESEFSTQMSNSGIILPKELQEMAKIYYSTKENTTQDIEDSKNGWTQSPSDFSQVKSYLIDLGDKSLERREKYEIYYEINFPNSLNYNQVSYSHHSVYFSLDTENGKYRTQTEPNKLGFRIAKLYDLELTKYQKGTNKSVSEAIYSIQEENEDEKTGVTDENGKINISRLYIDKTYIIKEIKSPSEYELNEEIIKFRAIEENGQIKVEKVSGNVRQILEVQPLEQKECKIKVEVEDEVKANLKIRKQSQLDGKLLSNVKYKLTGKGQGTGRILTTYRNGETNLKGLYIGEEYTLEEIKAEGYYLANPVKFIIDNIDGNYEVKIIEGIVKSNNITKENEIPTLNLVLEDEKIPEYNLVINKVVKDEETPIEGVKFGLYKGTERVDTFTTDSEGKLTITGLYQYVEEKQIDQTYTLKEVQAPEGYTKVQDITFYANKQNDLLDIQILSGTIKEKSVTGTTITITVEDSPTFKLIKKDGKTAELLEGVKFAIYNYETGKPATDSKGNIIGEKQVIKGKTYYVVTTNYKGEITANLPEGLYEAVELETYEKYELGTDIERIHRFGIGMTKAEEREYQVVSGDSVGGSSDDVINLVIETQDGGYLVGGYFYSENIQVGEYILTNAGNYNFDGMIIKYSSEDEVEWATSVGGNSGDYINSVIETQDGGYIVVGDFYSESIQIGEYTLTNAGSNDGMVIKYSNKGEVEWATAIGGNSSEKITSIIEVQDGGYVVVGDFWSESIQIGEYTLTNAGDMDEMIIKYSAKGEVEWATSIGGNEIDDIKSVIKTQDGGYVVGGNFYSDRIQIGEYTLTNAGDYNFDGMIIKYNAKGEVEWARSIGGRDYDYIYSVAVTQDGGYVVGGFFFSESIQVGEYTLTNVDSNDGMIIKYSAKGEVEWATSVGGNSGDYITSIIETQDGGCIVEGSFRSESIQVGEYTLTNVGDTDEMIIKYSAEGKVEWATSIGGINYEQINSISETTDGGYIAVGGFRSESIQVGEYILTNGEKYNFNGMAIKYSAEGKVQWAISVKGDSSEEITSVIEMQNEEYVVIGYFRNTSIQIGEHTLTNAGSNDGMILKIAEVVTEPEFPQTQEITVENNLKQFKITTAVEKVDGVKGGNISGELEKPYEIVEYGNNSTKEIKMTPDENYEITKITINGEEVKFNRTEDGSYILPQFENVKENKHIVVTYISIDKKDPEIIVHHYIKGTTTRVAQDDIYTGKIDEIYTTKPNMDIEDYELAQDENGQYIIPTNATGKYKKETQEIVYEYERKKVLLTVHHYLEGTTTKVTMPDGTEAEDITDKQVEGTEYVTEQVTPHKMYKIAEVPENHTGTYEKPEVVVTYYYKGVDSPGVVVHHIDTDTKEKLAEDEILPVRGNGKYGDPYTTTAKQSLIENYEVVVKTDNWQGTMTDELIEVTYEYRLKYNMEIVKYKKSTTDVVQGVKFNIKGDGLPEEGKEYITNNEGKIQINGLLAERQYTIQEISTNNNYILNDELVVIQTHRENGKLKAEVIRGTSKAIKVLEPASGSILPIVQLEIENEPKYELNVLKYKKGTEETIKGIKFNLKGNGLPEEGRNYVTDDNGKIKVTGIIPGEEYTIQEISTTNEYMINNEIITFKAYRENGNLKAEIISGIAKSIDIEEAKEGTVPQINLKIENEPKFNIEIVKYETGTDNKIQNARFKFSSNNILDNREYVTSRDGVIEIQRLNQNEVYTIKEIFAKGYYVDESDFTVKVERIDGKLQLECTGRINEENDSITASLIEKTNELPTVQINVGNVSIPKYTLELTKVGRRTGNLLEGAKFEISGAGRDEKAEKNYVTAKDGKLIIENLYEDEEYTLREVYPPEGYSLTEEPVVFKAVYNSKDSGGNGDQGEEAGGEESGEETPEGAENGVEAPEKTGRKGEEGSENPEDPEGPEGSGGEGDGETTQTPDDLNEGWNLQILSGTFAEDAIIENSTIKVKWEDELLFNLKKTDELTGEALEGAKFVIQDLEGNNAKDVSGNEVGVIENINGTEMRVLTTDKDGFISVEIAPGLYKAIEVQAPFGYKLSKNPTQYFGIENAQEGMYIGKAVWAGHIAGNRNDVIERVAATKDGGVLVAGETTSDDFDVGNNATITSPGMIIKYSKEGVPEWSKTTSGNVFGITETEDGGFAVVTSNGYVIKYDKNNNQEWERRPITDAMQAIIETEDYRIIAVGKGGKLVKYNRDGTEIWNKTESADNITAIAKTSDGGFITGGNVTGKTTLTKYDADGVKQWSKDGVNGYTCSVIETTDRNGYVLGGYFTQNIPTSTGEILINKGSRDGFIAKFDTNGNTEWCKAFGGSGMDFINYMIPTNDNCILAVGNVSGTVKLNDKIQLTSNGGRDGIVIKYNNTGEIEWATSMGGIKDDWFTSAVQTEDGRVYAGMYANGNVTLDNGKLYINQGGVDGLLVEIEETIVQAEVPEKQEIEFKDEKLTYNITTAVDGVGGTILGQEKDPYEIVKYKATSVRDIIATPNSGYAVKEITINGKAISFTRNQDGTVKLDKFTNMSENKHVVVKFTANPAEVIVHHYKDGTTEKVAESEIINGEVNQLYTSNAKTDLELYDVVTQKLPTNAEGKMTSQKIEVIYYYTLKNANVIVHHYKDGTTERLSPDEEIQGKIDDNYITTYKTDIENYEIVDKKLPTNAEGKMTLEPIEVIYYYKLIPKSAVTVHHYIEYTEEKVAEDESIEDRIGTDYETEPKTNLDKYEIVKEKLPTNATGKIEQEPTEVIYYYKLKDTKVIVHHYKNNTTESLASDETILGKIDDRYETLAKEDIKGYEVVESKLPTNSNGIMTEETIEVIYYYKQKIAQVENQIYKYGTEKITEKTQKLTYDIEYTSSINEYIGSAKVTITDKLPYEIDEEKSNLNGGIYNAEEKTITWTEEIENINTYENGIYSLDISKQIEIVYINMDYSVENISNAVKGEITLENGQEEFSEDTAQTQVYFKKNVIVTKVWNHTNNTFKRPESIKLQIKNGDMVVQEQNVTKANQVDINGEEITWEYEFTDLPKYDEQGNEIEYSISEAETETGDLDYYSQTINNEAKTITNEFIGPVIEIAKTATTQNNLEYVVKGEKITYTITVTNAGGVAKEILVKDTIPEGTTLVEGSIKVNNSDEVTLENLIQGIMINLEPNESKTVSFEVIVNDLENNQIISNIGVVNKTPENPDSPDELTDEVIHIYKEPVIEQRKTLLTENELDYVVEGEKITYMIIAENIGGIGKDILIKDAIPEGTSFVEGSIKVNGNSTYELNGESVDLKTKTAEDLSNGIIVNVPAQEGSINSQTMLSFEVTVNELEEGIYEKTLKNIAIVNKTPENPDSLEEPTNEVETKVKKADIIFRKESVPEAGSKVKAGDEITYKINVINIGTLYSLARVKDEIPAGTTFVEGSVKIDNKSSYELNGKTIDLSVKTANDLKEGIEIKVSEAEGKLAGAVELSFKVKVQDIENNAVIKNVAN